MLKRGSILLFIFSALIAKVVLQPSVEADAGIQYEVKGYKEYWFDRMGHFDNNQDYISAVNKARKEIAKIPVKRSLGIDWTEVGPDNIGGRTRALLIDSHNPKLMYAGGVAGGLWYSENGGQTWALTTPGDQEEFLTVTCITQDSDGYIYYGTGEGLFYGTPGTGGSGFIGKGVYRSRDPHGTDFKHMAGSWTPSNDDDFVSVNAMAADANGNIYAACLKRLYRSQDKGETWFQVSSTATGFVNKTGWDVKVGDNGYVMAALGDEIYYSATGDPGTYTIRSGGAMSNFTGRVTIAIAPSDNDVVYVSCANSNGQLDAIYQSKDKGVNWTKLIEGGSDFFEPFTGGGPQGNYDQCIAVYPDNPNRILLGGIELYRWTEGGNWEKLSQWNSDWGDHNYVHSDLHTIRFDNVNPDLFYIGTDGGLFRTINDGSIFERLNRGYAVTQFYGFAVGSDGVVLGGTQDNSNIYIDGTSNSGKGGVLHNSGDGGWSSISQLYPDAFFVESQHGRIRRNNTRAAEYTEFFQDDDSNLELDYVDYDGSWNQFINPMLLWESKTDTLIPDSVTFIAASNYNVNDEVTVASGITGQFFEHTLTSPLNNGEELRVKNPVQSLFIYPSYQGMWITREALDFSSNPKWFNLTNDGLSVSSRISASAIAMSKDGDELYYGNRIGEIYRVSNLSKVVSDGTVGLAVVTKIASLKTKSNSNAFVTSISVDPNDKDHVIATVGYYDEDVNVYVSTDASTSMTTNGFVSAQGNLPGIPVYSSLIEHYTGAYVVGTEYGVYSSTDNGVSWAKESNGLPYNTVAMIRQQTWEGSSNFGQIYVGTHGRGIFTSDHYVGTDNVGTFGSNDTHVKVYPNPTSSEFTIDLNAEITGSGLLSIVDVQGKLVYSSKVNITSGEIKNIDVHQLSKGHYVVKLVFNQQQYSSILNVVK